MNDGSSDREGDRKVSAGEGSRGGIVKPFWKAILTSFLLFWVFDLLTSATLISHGFGFLEYNPFIRTFFQMPSWKHFDLLIENQELYFVALMFSTLAPIQERVAKGKWDQLLYLPTAVILFVLALDRLNIGISSNTANLIAIMLRESVPASGSLYLLLWGVLDGLWAISVWLYLHRRRLGGASHRWGSGAARATPTTGL